MVFRVQKASHRATFQNRSISHLRSQKSASTHAQSTGQALFSSFHARTSALRTKRGPSPSCNYASAASECQQKFERVIRRAWLHIIKRSSSKVRIRNFVLLYLSVRLLKLAPNVKTKVNMHASSSTSRPRCSMCFRVRVLLTLRYRYKMILMYLLSLLYWRSNGLATLKSSFSWVVLWKVFLWNVFAVV